MAPTTKPETTEATEVTNPENALSQLVTLILDPSKDRPKRNSNYRFPTRLPEETTAKITAGKKSASNKELVLRGDFLIDGTNFVTREALEAMRENPWFARCVKMGVVTIVEPRPGTKTGTSLDYDEADAEIIIENSSDVAWLERCLLKEERIDVSGWCRDRINDINEEIAATKKEQGGE